MLKKELRLRKERDLKKVFTRGAYISGPLFNINYLKTKGTTTRLAVVTSKKISKKAVVRNKAKRQVREAIRLLYPKIIEGFDIVINIRQEALDSNFKKLQSELEKQLEKKNLIVKQ